MMKEVMEVFLSSYYQMFSSLYYVYSHCEEKEWGLSEKTDEALTAIIDEIIVTVGDNNISLDDYETYEDYNIALERFLEDNDLHQTTLREELCGYCFDRW